MAGQRPVDKSQTQSYCNEYQFGKYSVVRNCINYASHASAYKLMHLDVDDHQLLSETYQAMYPDKNIQANTVSYRPFEIWRQRTFNRAGPATFMRVQRCYCKFASSYVKMNGVEKLIVSPIQRTFC